MTTKQSFVKFTIALVSLIMGGLSAGNARGLYLAGEGGVSLLEDVDVEQVFGGPVPGTGLEFDTGLRVGLKTGYEFCDWFAAELEVAFTYNSVRDVTSPGVMFTTKDAALYQLPVMANGVFQYRNSSRWTPYAGFGVGAVVSVLRIDDISGVDADGELYLDGADVAVRFGYQVMAGVRFAISQRAELAVGYKFLAVRGAQYSGFDGGADGMEGETGIKLDGTHSHSFLATFSWSF